jgi:serine/threonine protein kinase
MPTDDQMNQPSRAPQTGDVLGQYRLFNVLAIGGMGTVFKAYEAVLERVVAIKILNPQLAHDPEVASHFLREARTVANLDHPNIVKVHNAGQQGELFYFVMELVDGPALEAWRREHRDFPPHEAIGLIRQAALGLQHAHNHGIIHGDIKPANLLLNSQGTVKVADFGLARRFRGEAGPDTAASVFGTPEYISPEAVQGRPTDLRSDIYSLGVTLYYLLAGELPFTGKSPDELLHQHLVGTPRRLTVFNPQVPIMVEQIVARMMARDPLRRYQSYDDLIRALDQAVPRAAHHQQLALGSQSTGPRLPVARPVVKKDSSVTAVMVLLFLIVGGMGAWWWHHEQQSAPESPPPPAAPVVVPPPAPVEDINQQALHTLIGIKSKAEEAMQAGNYGAAWAAYDRWPADRYASTPAAATVTAERARIMEQARQDWPATLEKIKVLILEHKFDEAMMVCNQYVAAREGMEELVAAANEQRREIQQVRQAKTDAQVARATKVREVYTKVNQQIDPLILDLQWIKARDQLERAGAEAGTNSAAQEALAPLRTEMESLMALRTGIATRFKTKAGPIVSLATRIGETQGRILSLDDRGIRLRRELGTTGFAETAVTWAELLPASVDQVFRSCLDTNRVAELFGYAVLVTHQALAAQVPLKEARTAVEAPTGLDAPRKAVAEMYLKLISEAEARLPVAHAPQRLPDSATLEIWNQHAGETNGRGTKQCNVVLLQGNRELWRRDKIDLEWKPDQDCVTTLSLPVVPFDKIRIEVTAYHHKGGGLAEVILKGSAVENLRPINATASGVFHSEAFPSGYPPRNVLDGVTSSATLGKGYWLLPNRTTGWIEITYARDRR